MAAAACASSAGRRPPCELKLQADVSTERLASLPLALPCGPLLLSLRPPSPLHRRLPLRLRRGTLYLRPPPCLRRYPAVCQRDPTLLRRRHLHSHATTRLSGCKKQCGLALVDLSIGDVRRVCSPGRRLVRRPSALSRLASAPAPHPPTPHARRGSRPQTPPPVPTRVISGSQVSRSQRASSIHGASRSGSGGSRLQPHPYLC